MLECYCQSIKPNQLIQISIPKLYTQFSVQTKILMIKLKWPIFLLLASLAYLSLPQQCIPKYDLENIIQDQIVIYPIAQNGIMQSSNIYPFPRTFFTSTPNIISSLDTYQISSFTEINYFLTLRVNRASVNFTFNSQNMEWAFLRVKFWLTARSDLLVGSFVLQNISSGTQKTHEIAIPTNFSTFIDEKTLHLNFITGLKAKTNGNQYSIDVKNSGKSADGTIFRVTVSSLASTQIQRIEISYSIFNFESSFFASGGGQLNYQDLKGSQYKKIHGSFSPIIYLMNGFDKIRLAKQGGFNLQFTFDQDYVVETYTTNTFNELGVVYLSIGRQPSSVCLCDKYIQFDACVDQCPSLTYPYVKYAKGGKTCLTCSAKLNETINQFNTGCDCMEGFERFDQYCLQKALVLECVAKNTVLSNGACICVAGTQSVNGNCENRCKINEFYNSSSTNCECEFGYFNISQVCGVCPTGQLYNSTFRACGCPQFQYLKPNTNVCICIPGYYDFEGTCVTVCPTGYAIQNDRCSLVIKCKLNQIVQNGRCVCSSGNYIVNGNCSTCPSSTYYNTTSQTCINCLSNCAVCFSFLSCAQCKKQYFYNSTSNQCQMNVSCKANQTLSNGICNCVEGTYRVGDQCTVCTQGNYYDAVGRICRKCTSNCLLCQNLTSCSVCLPNHTFNSLLGFCAPNCGTNQTLVNGSCQCVQGTFRINGVCNRCPSSQFYDSANQGCFSCLANCLSCINPFSCDRCLNFFFFNSVSGRCEPSNCPINETIINGRCDCIQGTFRISGACSTCRSSQFYDARNQICGNCSFDCVRCTNQVTCVQCEPYHRLINNECRFNLYDLKPGYPKFTQKLIITDFTTSQPLKNRAISPEQLQKIVKIEFDNKNLEPSQTIIQQNPRNASEVRIIYSYCGNIPFQNFNANYTFNDPKISVKQDVQIANYNPLNAKSNNLYE